MSQSVLGKLGEIVRDAIAPTFCVQCEAIGGWLCSVCAEQILLVKEQVCYRCGRLNIDGKTCNRCRRYTDLNGVMVAAHYEAGPVREMVHQLKYGAMTELAGLLSGMLIHVTQGRRWMGWTVVPVPLHISRLTTRGFNQADLLGHKLATHLGAAYQPKALRRVRSTNTQIELTRPNRRANVYRAFAARASLQGMKILLVDDVMTTGATLEDCARACKDAGAKTVWAVVVARG